MNTNIEFASPDENNNNETTPWVTPKKSTYQDLVLKPEYEARRLRFPLGTTWLRIVPALQSSMHGWMFPIHVLNFEGGRFAHPKTLRKNAKSVFDHAYEWAKEHHPDSLYRKENKTGARFLTDPMCVFWTIVEEGGKHVARLLLASGYDGSRGGVPGLGYQIWRMTRERDESGALVTDAIAPDAGMLVSIEKTQPKGAKYPSYALRLGRQPAPMNALLSKMEAGEVGALCPLENVVRELTHEEEWRCLERVIAPDTVTEIRTSLTPAK